MRLKFFVIVITFVITAWHTIYGQQTSDPMPFTENNRIITMIVSYHLHHFEPIIETLKNCKYMCEAGWSPTIVIFTAGNVTHNIRNYVNSHLYCYRTEVNCSLRSLSCHCFFCII